MSIVKERKGIIFDKMLEDPNSFDSILLAFNELQSYPVNNYSGIHQIIIFKVPYFNIYGFQNLQN